MLCLSSLRLGSQTCMKNDLRPLYPFWVSGKMLSCVTLGCWTCGELSQSLCWAMPSGHLCQQAIMRGQILWIPQGNGTSVLSTLRPSLRLCRKFHYSSILLGADPWWVTGSESCYLSPFQPVGLLSCLDRQEKVILHASSLDQSSALMCKPKLSFTQNFYSFFFFCLKAIIYIISSRIPL